MKNLTVAALLLTLLMPALGFAQPDQTIVPFGSDAYLYQFVKASDIKIQKFLNPTIKDADVGGWSSKPAGEPVAAWGTLNKPGTDPCPLNISANVKVLWPSGRDVLIRKWIKAEELTGASNVRVSVALDNAVEVYWNGQPVWALDADAPAGRFTHDVCAEETEPGSKRPKGDVTFRVTRGMLDAAVTADDGSQKHLLAVRGVTLSEKSYIDVKVVADLGYTLTVNEVPEGLGNVTISPMKEYYSPDDQITLTAIVTEPGHFFGRGTSPETIQTGWEYVPFAATDDRFANPVTFSIAENTTVNAHFTKITPQDFIPVSDPRDYNPDTDEAIKNTLRWAIEQAEDYPGLDEIRIGVNDTIFLKAPLSATDLLSIKIDGSNYAIIKPAATSEFGSESGLNMPGVFVKWGYEPGGITLSGLQIQDFLSGPGLSLESNGNTVDGCLLTNNREGICIHGDYNTVTRTTITANAGDGICIVDGNGNTIGGLLPLQGNAIFKNEGRGVSIRELSVNDAIAPPDSNAILGNSIYLNSGLGIDFADGDGNFGVTMNRYLDLPPYSGAKNSSDFINGAQNYPDLESAEPGSNIVKGRLYGPSTGKSYRVEVFRNSTSGTADDVQTLIGSKEVSQPTSQSSDYGIYAFEFTTTQEIRLGDVITATATDENSNTSEFSPAIYAGVITRKYGPVEKPNEHSNRWVVNTTFRGDPIHWPNGVATFSIEDGFPEDYADTALTALGPNGPWNYSGSPLSVSKATSPGPADAWGGIPDGVNNVVYATESEFLTKTDPGFKGTLAVARVRYNSFTAEIFDADVMINGGLVNTAQTAGADQYIFESVFAHELGHALGGLGDIYDRNDQPYNLFMGTNPAQGEVTMYGIIRPSDTYQTTVHQDDKEGLNFIFGNVSPAHVDLALVIDASRSFADPAAYDAFAPSIDAAIELVDKLRTGDGVAVVGFPGSDPTSTFSVPVRFERIGFHPTEAEQDQRNRIKGLIAAIQPASGDDRRPIGDALKAAAGELNNTANPGRRAGILFSAGNETESPSALDYNEVLQGLTGSNPVRVFTMGFGTPEGDNLGSRLADATGGLFYEADITTISPIANHAWDVLTGNQLVLDKQAYSTGEDDAISYQGSPTWKAISWQGAKNLAISWQGGANSSALAWEGNVDEGTTGLYPAISWQGSGKVAKVSSEKASAGGPKFHLALITPDFPYDFLTYPWQDAANWEDPTDEPPGTISPGNLPDGVEYVTDETYGAYAFYRITAEYAGTRNGKWILVPIGANPEATPTEPVAVNWRLATVTDVVMEVVFDKSNYLPGEPVKINVSLFEGGLVQASHTVGAGPITGKADSVKGLVVPPGGDPEKPILVEFREVGGGVYEGELSGTQTTARGTYSFVVTAEGTAPVSKDYFFRKFDQSVYVAPVYASAALFAQQSVTMQDGSRIITGDVLVNQPAPPESPAVSLLVGPGASTPGGYVIKADRIQVLEGARVASTIYTSQDPVNAGTITTTPITGFEFPMFEGNFGGFPPFNDATGNFSPNQSVGTGGFKPLGPESPTETSYGDVTLEPHSTLTLEPGVYNFRSLRIKTSGRVLFTGPTEIRIRRGIHADNGSYFGTSPDLSVAPSDIIVYVQGTNAEGPGSYSVDFSPKSKVLASLFAKNGTILLNQETQAAGALFAQNIVLGNLTTVRLSSGFGILAKSATSGEIAGPADDGSVPKTYELSQNYPNPFNPTTQIKYGLPQAGPVNLTVYNMLGQEVARLVDEVQPEGYHVVEWNGRNTFGSAVSSGMYVFQLKAGDFIQTKKMMLLK